jgi:hypothetical protein
LRWRLRCCSPRAKAGKSCSTTKYQFPMEADRQPVMEGSRRTRRYEIDLSQCCEVRNSGSLSASPNSTPTRRIRSGLPRARRERPRSRAAEKRNEIPSPHANSSQAEAHAFNQNDSSPAVWRTIRGAGGLGVAAVLTVSQNGHPWH